MKNCWVIWKTKAKTKDRGRLLAPLISGAKKVSLALWCCLALVGSVQAQSLVHADSNPPDAVVFLGPTTHFDGKLPGQTLEKIEQTPLHFSISSTRGAILNRTGWSA